MLDGGTNTRYYYHFDGLGSVVALSNVNGGMNGDRADGENLVGKRVTVLMQQGEAACQTLMSVGTKRTKVVRNVAVPEEAAEQVVAGKR